MKMKRKHPMPYGLWKRQCGDNMKVKDDFHSNTSDDEIYDLYNELYDSPLKSNKNLNKVNKRIKSLVNQIKEIRKRKQWRKLILLRSCLLKVKLIANVKFTSQHLWVDKGFRRFHK